MSRNSHHRTGRLSRPPELYSAAWPPVAHRRFVAFADAAVQRQQELIGRAVGTVDGEAPVEPLGLGDEFLAVPLQSRLVVGAPVLGAAGGDHLAGFGFGEFHAPGIGEGFLRRVHDLDKVALRAVGGKLG
jgi:hypothetical protein